MLNPNKFITFTTSEAKRGWLWGKKLSSPSGGKRSSAQVLQ